MKTRRRAAARRGKRNRRPIIHRPAALSSCLASDEDGPYLLFILPAGLRCSTCIKSIRTSPTTSVIALHRFWRALFFFFLVGWLVDRGRRPPCRTRVPAWNVLQVQRSPCRPIRVAERRFVCRTRFFFSENQRDPVPITPRKTASRDRLRHVIDASRRRVSCFFFNVFVASFFLFVFSYFGA